MKNLKFWQVDAFTNQFFKGNPAIIFVLNKELDEKLMQNIAAEMNQSETAFLLKQKEGSVLLRWFTPMYEIDLCGHATLASAHIYLNEIYPQLSEVIFDTKFVGQIRVERNGNGYTMSLPSRSGEQLSLNEIPPFVYQALTDAQPIDAYKARDLMLIYENDLIIKNMKPNFNALMRYKDSIIVTAKSSDLRYDFISRFFCANDSIVEDPVTGSAHCTSTPYWSSKLGKTHLKAYQASSRGGELDLENQKDRILITGRAVTVTEGKMRI